VLLDEWENKVLAGRDISGSTRTRHRWALKILRADLGGTKVRSLTPDRVETALQARADGGLSRGSLDKVKGTLSQVLNWAVRRDVVARNVASVVELPATARAAKEGRTLTLAQAKAFLDAASGTPSRRCGRSCCSSVFGLGRPQGSHGQTSASTRA